MEPPDPHQIASALREQLSQLRALIALAPEQQQYSVAAELVTRAIVLLDRHVAIAAR